MLKKILIVSLVVIGLVLFLLLREWNSPELGKALLDIASDRTGIEMTAGSFKLSLLRGLLLENVGASSSAPGRQFEFSSDRLIFEHRIAPLLSGTVSIKRIVLDHPQFELVESGLAAPAETDRNAKPEDEPPGAEGAVPPDAVGPRLEIDEIAVIEATLVIRSKGRGTEGESTIRMDNLHLRARELSYHPQAPSRIHAFGGKGDLEIGAVALDSTRITDVRGQFQLADGRAELKPFTFSTPPGRFTAEMGLDFNPVPFQYTLSLEADPLDFNRVVNAEQGFGPGRLSLDAEGSGPDSQDLEGRGLFKLAGGEFPATPLLRLVDETLGRAVLVGTPYEPTEVRVSIANNVLRLEPFELEAEKAKLELEGWVNLEGPLELGLGLGTVRQDIRLEGVSANVLDVLTDENGWVMIPIEVTGSLEKPRVRPDTRALLAHAGQGTRRLVQEKAVEGLEDLLGRKKKP